MDYPEDFHNKVILGDCRKVMRKMPKGSVDLIITSPPYNLKNSSGNWLKSKDSPSRWQGAELQHGYKNHDDKMPHWKYVRWQRSCLRDMMRLLKNTGAIFYVHKWRVQNGLLQDRQDIVRHFPVRQIIIWQRAGGVNFNESFFLPTYEVIYLIAKKDFMLTFEGVKKKDIWYFPQDSNNRHPAPFPLPLADRIITSTTAQTILDPFAGSGTVAVSARKHGRTFIAIDNAEEYVQMARDRLEEPYSVHRRPNAPSKGPALDFG